MAEKPTKNLALYAFREQFSTLYSALTSQPELVLRLASKLYKRGLISQETRDAIQLTTGNTGYQAARLLAASESTIVMNPRILRQFPRILRKESTLKSVAEALKGHYRALISEAGQVETSSSDSDSDTEIEYQREEAGEIKSSKSGHSDSEYTEHGPELGVAIKSKDGDISAIAPGLSKRNPALKLIGTRVKKETLPRVLNLLSPLLHSWDLFVQQIGVPTYKVSEIVAANANRGPNWLYTCFTQAMEWWVANYASPIYEVIIAVLDPEMGQITPIMNRTLANEVRKFLATEWGEFVTVAGQAESSDAHSETEHTEHQEIGVLVTEASQAESSDANSEIEHQKKVTSGDHESQAEERKEYEISFSDLEFRDELGEGGFFQDHWQSRDMNVSIKRVPGKLHKGEIEILNQLNHPGVIQFYGVVVDNPGPEHYIVTELAEGGSLYDLLHKKHHQPSPEQSLQWATDIAEGMNYLHQKKMMHKDLKSSNVLLTDGGNIKICDFGGAKCCDHSTKQTQTGKHRWMAPEVMKGEPVSLSSDVFSYGMLLYEVFAYKLPFADAKTDTEVTSKVKSQEMPLIPASIEPYLTALIRLCWDTDPKVRPSFEDILEILKTRGELSGQNKQFAQLMKSTITESQPHSQFQLKWRKIAELPHAMIRPHIVHINNTTYCGGGGSGDVEADRKVFQYNNERDEWSALPLCPTTNHALVELNGNLISVGGIEHNAPQNTPTDSVYVLEDLQWRKTMPPLAIARFHASAITYNSHAIVCGGVTSWINHKNCTCTSTVEVYSSDTNQWTTSTPLPFALCRMSTAIVNDMCYVIGGAAQEGIDIVAACASLPVLTRSAEGQQASTSHPSLSSTMWEILPKCPCYGSTAAELGGYILALGGLIPPSTADVHHYSRSSNSWSKVTGAKLPVASYFATTTTLPSGAIMLIGGAEKSDRHLNTVYIAFIHSTSQ